VRRPSKPKATKTDTAGAILVAARQILDEKGLAAIAMRQVAAQVGITPMAIYKHYADRNSLLNAVADLGFKDIATRAEGLALRGNVEQRLMQVGSIFLDTALQAPNMYQLMFLVSREGARVYPQAFKAGRSPTFNPTVKILDDAMRNGELRRDDPVEIAFELSAVSHGLILMYLGGRIVQGDKQFRSLYRNSFRRYLNGLRP
jgi:AcrR family transcriptional regulator